MRSLLHQPPRSVHFLIPPDSYFGRTRDPRPDRPTTNCHLGTFRFQNFDDIQDETERSNREEKERERIRSACSTEGAWHTDDEYYCWLHLPVKEKGASKEFKKALQERFNETGDLNFRGVYFPERLETSDIPALNNPAPPKITRLL